MAAYLAIGGAVVAGIGVVFLGDAGLVYKDGLRRYSKELETFRADPQMSFGFMEPERPPTYWGCLKQKWKDHIW